MEKHVTQVLGDQLINNSVLCPRQVGFRLGHSTEAVMLSVLDDLRHLADRNQPAALVLFDPLAAFNTINHNILLSRLEVGGEALQFRFRSFFSDRTYAVHMGPF